MKENQKGAVGPFVVRRVFREDRGNGTTKKTVSYFTGPGWSNNLGMARRFDTEASARQALRDRLGEIVPEATL